MVDPLDLPGLAVGVGLPICRKARVLLATDHDDIARHQGRSMILHEKFRQATTILLPRVEQASRRAAGRSGPNRERTARPKPIRPARPGRIVGKPSSIRALDHHQSPVLGPLEAGVTQDIGPILRGAPGRPLSQIDAQAWNVLENGIRLNFNRDRGGTNSARENQRKTTTRKHRPKAAHGSRLRNISPSRPELTRST